MAALVTFGWGTCVEDPVLTEWNYLGTASFVIGEGGKTDNAPQAWLDALAGFVRTLRLASFTT